MTSTYKCNTNSGFWETDRNFICESEAGEDEIIRTMYVPFGDSLSNGLKSDEYYKAKDYRAGVNVVQKCGNSGSSDYLSADRFIRTPSSGCTELSNYRLEDDLVVHSSQPFYATPSCCGNSYFFDTNPTSSMDNKRNYGFRKIHISFKSSGLHIKYPTINPDYAIIIYKGLLTRAQKIYEGDPNLVSRYIINTEKDLAIKLWKLEDTDVSGIMEMPMAFRDNAGLLISTEEKFEQKYTVAIVRTNLNEDSAPYSSYNLPYGTSTTFTVKNWYTYHGKDYNKREMNLLVMKNAGTTFNSDITQYNYNAKNFKDHVNDNWVNEVHCKVNYKEENIMPIDLVDASGNLVLIESDLPLNKKFVDPQVGRIVTAKEFRNYMNILWFRRYKNFTRIVLGENGRPNQTPQNTTLDDMLSKDSEGNELKFSNYRNVVAMCVVDSFSIKATNFQTTQSELTDDLKSFLDGYIKSKNISQLSPDAITQGYGVNEGTYTPLCLIFGYQTREYFKRNTPEFQGKIIENALHEMAHGWFFSGATKDVPIDADYKTYFEGHVDRNYRPYNESTDDYYCIMKPKGKYDDNYDAAKGYFLEEMKRMKYSAGVLERLRNIAVSTDFNNH